MATVKLLLCWTQMFMQAQFAQMRPVTMPPSVAPRMPMYPPGGPGMGQQIFYGQGPPAIIPSQVSHITVVEASVSAILSGALMIFV